MKMNTIKAKFKGLDGSLGYKYGEVYSLYCLKISDFITIKRVDNNKEGDCEYSSLQSFLNNWDVEDTSILPNLYDTLKSSFESNKPTIYSKINKELSTNGWAVFRSRDKRIVDEVENYYIKNGFDVKCLSSKHECEIEIKF